MGRASRLRDVSSPHQRVTRERLQAFADQVADEAAWGRVLDQASSPAVRAELEETVGPLLAFRRCGNRDCISGQPARWLPVLVLRSGRFPQGTMGRVTVQRRLCADCRLAVTIEDVLDDAGWDRIASQFALWPRQPERGLTQLEFETIQ